MTGELLIAFGFAWMVVAALIGLYLGAKHPKHTEQLTQAAAANNLAQYHAVFEAYKWRSSVHAHGMLFALSSVAVGLVLSRHGAATAVPFAQALAGAFVAATVVWTGAALRRVRPLMGLADLTFVGAMVFVAFSIARNS